MSLHQVHGIYFQIIHSAVHGISQGVKLYQYSHVQLRSLYNCLVHCIVYVIRKKRLKILSDKSYVWQLVQRLLNTSVWHPMGYLYGWLIVRTTVRIMLILPRNQNFKIITPSTSNHDYVHPLKGSNKPDQCSTCQFQYLWKQPTCAVLKDQNGANVENGHFYPSCITFYWLNTDHFSLTSWKVYLSC